MKTSITNKASVTGVTAESGVLANAGKEAENILIRNTGRVYEVTGNLDITIDNLGNIDADMICLFNVSFNANLVLTLFDSSDIQIETTTLTSADYTESGWEFKNLLYETTSVSGDLDKITITTTGASVDKWVGYIWVGDWIEFQCHEKVQAFSISDDSGTITRSNRPEVKYSYRYRTFDMTLDKLQGYKDLRDNIELILDDGFILGRPFYLNNPPFNGELYFANLDSPKVGFDFFFDATETDLYTAQVTIGIREVK